MSQLWKDAAALLRKAADTIEARSRLRDAEGEPDLMNEAAELLGVEPGVIITSMLAVKMARFNRCADLDSAVDHLAYSARLYVDEMAERKPVRPVVPPTIDDDEPPLRAAPILDAPEKF